MKKCSKCKVNKELELFSKDNSRKDGKCNNCKDCVKLINKKSNKNDPVKAKKYYYPDRAKYQNDWYHRNKIEVNKKIVDKRKNSIINRLQHNSRCRISKVIARKQMKKTSRTSMMLGCSYKELIAHLESKFKTGMTWENYGEWHIDHIIPISSGKTIEEINSLSKYTNLQPLWAEDNIRKGASII
jgi:hypothetical protein